MRKALRRLLLPIPPLFWKIFCQFVFFNKSELKLHVCSKLNKYIKDLYPIPIENVKYALVDLAKYWVRGWQVIWNNEKKIAGSHASYISAQPCSAPVHYRTKGQTERCVRWALQCRALFSSVQKVQCLVKIKPQITILALTGRTGLKRFMSKKKAWAWNVDSNQKVQYLQPCTMETNMVTSRLKRQYITYIVWNHYVLFDTEYKG